MHRWTILGGWVVVGIFAVLISYGCGTGEATCIELLNCEPIGGQAGGVGGIGGSGGGQPTGEDCMNGVDDDEDIDVDCGDSDCGSIVGCIDAAPLATWDGWYRLSIFDYGDDIPACLDGESPKVIYSEPNDDSSVVNWCEECSCLGAAVPCTIPPMVCYLGTINCMGGSSNTAINIPDTADTCATVGDFPMAASPNQQDSCEQKFDSTPSLMGMCQAAGGTKITTPPWRRKIAACHGNQVGSAGCAAGQICAPLPLGEPSYVCISKDGDVVCPDGGDWVKFVGYTGELDGRGCSTCSCPTGLCSQPKYTFYDDNMCTGQSTTIDVACRNLKKTLSDPATWSLQVVRPEAPCTSEGGAPEGNVEGLNPITYCCK